MDIIMKSNYANTMNIMNFWAVIGLNSMKELSLSLSTGTWQKTQGRLKMNSSKLWLKK